MGKTCMEEIRTVIENNPAGKRPLGRLGKIVLLKNKDVEMIEAAEDLDRWRNAVVYLRVG